MECTTQQIIHYLKENNLYITSRIKSNEPIKHLSYDSRNCKNGTLFFCKGLQFKEEYLNTAIHNHASCYMSEIEYNNDCDHIIVSDIKKAMAYISSLFFNHPSTNLTTIGITGTKGKTTVAYFLKNIFDIHSNNLTGLIGTKEVITGKQHKKATLTTPESIDLHSYFNEAIESEFSHFIMEVTSQAYKMNRVDGVQFSYGLFLNIGPDHISDIEHPTFEDYFNCKLQMIQNTDQMIICNTMDNVQNVINECKTHNIPYVTYGADDSATYQIKNIKKQHSGYSFDLYDSINLTTYSFSMNMNGIFNIENAVAAIIVSLKENIHIETIQKGLIATDIPGRMNIFKKDDITFVVDYAHNRISFQKLYEALKTDYPNQKLITVGGVPGNKAYTRRKDFAEVVGSYSDYIYLTADDPQYEEVDEICNEIIKHFDKSVQYEIIEDRIDAAEAAFKNATKNDIIILLAKGDDNIQRIRGEYVEIESDIDIAKRLLNV